jgi:molybdopterin biosynthesis enzyme
MGDVSVIRNLRPVQDCASTPDSITVDEVLRRIRQRSVPATGSEVVAVDEARRRFLAADVASRTNGPAPRLP